MKQLITLTLLAFLAVGCSNKSGGGGGVTADTDTNTNTDTDVVIVDPGAPNDDEWGAMGYLDLIDTDAFEEFSGYVTDDLRNERIYIKLEEVKNGSQTYYAGEVRLAYERVTTKNILGSGAGTQEIEYKNPRFEAKEYTEDELEENPGHLDYTWQGVRFNKMYTKNGQEFLVAFFEEPDFYDWSVFDWNPNGRAGAIMLMITDLDDSGFSGSVWFKNYSYTYAVKPTYTRCWEISIGPYDCRDFVVNDKIRPDLDNTPNTYQKLGEFYNLDVSQAFDN